MTEGLLTGGLRCSGGSNAVFVPKPLNDGQNMPPNNANTCPW